MESTASRLTAGPPGRQLAPPPSSFVPASTVGRPGELPAQFSTASSPIAALTPHDAPSSAGRPSQTHPASSSSKPDGLSRSNAPPPSVSASSTSRAKGKGKAPNPSKASKTKAKSVATPSRSQNPTDDEEEDGLEDLKPGGKQKRKRVERACHSCRQRRSKCDGQQPCAVCSHAKVECSYPPPARRVSMKYVEELESKLKEFEEQSEQATSNNPPAPVPLLPRNQSPGSKESTAEPSYQDHVPLPSLHQVAGQVKGSRTHSSHPWPGAEAPSVYGRPPPDRANVDPTYGGYGSNGGQSSSYPYPPAQGASYQPPSKGPLQYGTHDRPPLLPPLTDAARYALSGPSYGQHSRWSPNNLGMFVDHAPSQMRSSAFPTPESTSTSAANPDSSYRPPTQTAPIYSTSYTGSGNGQGYSYPPSHTYAPPHLSQTYARVPDQAPETPDYTPPEDHRRGSHPSDSSNQLFHPHPSNLSGPGPPTSGERNKSPLDSSLDELSEDVSEDNEPKEEKNPEEEVLKTVFEDAIYKWERVGTDGHAADFVEKAAAKYTGRDIKSKMPMPGQNIDQSITEAMVPSPSSPDMFEMAPREVCDLLVKFYHERVQYIFPVLCWPVFYDQYSRIIAAPSPAEGSRLKSSEQIIRATINVLLAISASLRCFPGDALMSNSCFRRAQALVSVPHLLLMGNVPIIQYLLLLCYHSQSSSKGNLSANAGGLGLLMARGIQLNNQQVNETFSPQDQRVRERVWLLALQMESTSAAMLFRPTTTSEADFQALASPSLVDDEERPPQDYSVLGRDKTPKTLGFFKEVCTLTAIKSKTLRSLYSISGANTFPDSTIVLQIEEELLTFWQDVPDYLRVEKAPNMPLFQLQAHILKCRYNNTRILLYRPFLFHFCSTPGGTYPIPDSLRFNLARKSARVCLDCAVEQVEQILSKTHDEMQGHYWFNLGHLYTSALVLLAHRLVNLIWPEEHKEEVERLTIASLRKVMDYFVVLGWHSTEEVSPQTALVTPTAPINAIRTARRIFRIVKTLDKIIKEPDAAPKASAMSTTEPIGKHHPMAIGPNRYARYPDPTVPPLHLEPPTNTPFSDDAFMASWISLMHPSYRDGDIIPPDYQPPATPFDLQRQNLGTNTEGESNWQGWESLLGMGYFSNLMPDNGEDTFR